MTPKFSPRSVSTSTFAAAAIPSPCVKDQKHAGGIKNISSPFAIGASGKIKTRYGKLCQEGTSSTDEAFSDGWVNAGIGQTKWAQSGFDRSRNPGSTSINTYRYAECHAATTQQTFTPSLAPAEGSSHVYQCDLDEITGTWTFLFDGTAWEHFQDNGWKNVRASDVQWKGEVLNKDDDMPGTAADKCNFTECKYRKSGSAYQDAGLVAGDVTSENPSEFGAQWVSDTAFDIWDKNPHP